MIKVGDQIPSMTLTKATAEGPKPVTTDEIFKGRTVVLFAVPGAFTPTCSAKHLPGYVQNFAALKAKGVDEVVCMAVNDGFVMGAWGREQGVGDNITMLSDGSAALRPNGARRQSKTSVRLKSGLVIIGSGCGLSSVPYSVKSEALARYNRPPKNVG